MLCFAVWIDGFSTGFQCVCVCDRVSDAIMNHGLIMRELV